MSSSVDIGAATAASRWLYLAYTRRNQLNHRLSKEKNFMKGDSCFCLSPLDRESDELSGANCGMEAVAASSCPEEELDEAASPSSWAIPEVELLSGRAGVERHEVVKARDEEDTIGGQA